MHRVFPDHLAAPKPPLHQSLTCHELRRPQHLQGWPASTCLRPNDLETFRHALRTSRLLPVTPKHLRYIQATSRSLQITCRSPADHPQITHSSTGTPGTCLEMLKLENSGDSDANQVTQYRGLGPPSWLTPTPGYVAHVCYLTTPKAPPEMPCRTTFVRIRRPE